MFLEFDGLGLDGFLLGREGGVLLDGQQLLLGAFVKGQQPRHGVGVEPELQPLLVSQPKDRINPPTLVELTEKVALELVYALPGRDEGLLPVNSLLGEIEEMCLAAPPDERVRQAVAVARQSVDSCLLGGGFSAPELERLGAWAKWMD